jgi:hypothetical protein
MASENVYVRATGYQNLALKFMLNPVEEKFVFSGIQSVTEPDNDLV